MRYLWALALLWGGVAWGQTPAILPTPQMATGSGGNLFFSVPSTGTFTFPSGGGTVETTASAAAAFLPINNAAATGSFSSSGNTFLGTTVSSQTTNGFEIIPESSGTSSEIVGSGVDANQNVNFFAAGTGQIILGNSTTGTIAEFSNALGGTPGNVDYMVFTSFNSSYGEVISTTAGPSGNVNFQQRCQGSGCTWSFIPNGNQPVLLLTQSSSGVNGLEVDQSNSGSPVNLTVHGSDSSIPLKITAANVQIPSEIFVGPSSQTLSGSTTLIPTIYENLTIFGTTTDVNYNVLPGLFALRVGEDDSNASSEPAGLNYESEDIQIGGSNFLGNRTGFFGRLLASTPSVLTQTTNFVGSGFEVASQVNFGGSSSNYLGSMFGSNYVCKLSSGATYWNECIGQEVDGEIDSGASVSSFAVEQLVLQSGHDVHGVFNDELLEFGAQVGAGAGVRNIMTFGRYDSQYPGDPNGYIAQVQESQNGVSDAGAGGFDLNQFIASGSGPEGGGFDWRSPGVQIKPSEVQSGYASLFASSNNESLDTNYQQMTATTGSITVGSSGSNYESGNVATDSYGDTVIVSATSGSVTGVTSVLTRGWQKTPPSNPVSFTARTCPANPCSLGSGLTLNLSWTAENSLSIEPSGGTIQFGSGAYTANGSTSVSLTSVAPSGAHATVQEWLTVKDASGTVRYIPAF